MKSIYYYRCNGIIIKWIPTAHSGQRVMAASWMTKNGQQKSNLLLFCNVFLPFFNRILIQSQLDLITPGLFKKGYLVTDTFEDYLKRFFVVHALNFAFLCRVENFPVSRSGNEAPSSLSSIPGSQPSSSSYFPEKLMPALIFLGVEKGQVRSRIVGTRERWRSW